LSQLQYKIVEPGALTSENTMSTLMSLLMLGLAGLVLIRVTRGGVGAVNKKFTQGDIPNITFDDVAGIDECRAELVDIVAFLKGNSKYHYMGAHMPRGLLLVGEP